MENKINADETMFKNVLENELNAFSKEAKSINKYYQYSDGWFTYYVNVETGDKKFNLDKDDILVESNLDDFSR